MFHSPPTALKMQNLAEHAPPFLMDHGSVLYHRSISIFDHYSSSLYGFVFQPQVQRSLNGSEMLPEKTSAPFMGAWARKNHVRGS